MKVQTDLQIQTEYLQMEALQSENDYHNRTESLQVLNYNQMEPSQFQNDPTNPPDSVSIQKEPLYAKELPNQTESFQLLNAYQSTTEPLTLQKGAELASLQAIIDSQSQEIIELTEFRIHSESQVTELITYSQNLYEQSLASESSFLDIINCKDGEISKLRTDLDDMAEKFGNLEKNIGEPRIEIASYSQTEVGDTVNHIGTNQQNEIEFVRMEAEEFKKHALDEIEVVKSQLKAGQDHLESDRQAHNYEMEQHDLGITEWQNYFSQEQIRFELIKKQLEDEEKILVESKLRIQIKEDELLQQASEYQNKQNDNAAAENTVQLQDFQQIEFDASEKYSQMEIYYQQELARIQNEHQNTIMDLESRKTQEILLIQDKCTKEIALLHDPAIQVAESRGIMKKEQLNIREQAKRLDYELDQVAKKSLELHQKLLQYDGVSIEALTKSNEKHKNECTDALKRHEADELEIQRHQKINESLKATIAAKDTELRSQSESLERMEKYHKNTVKMCSVAVSTSPIRKESNSNDSSLLVNILERLNVIEAGNNGLRNEFAKILNVADFQGRSPENNLQVPDAHFQSSEGNFSNGYEYIRKGNGRNGMLYSLVLIIALIRIRLRNE